MKRPRSIRLRARGYTVVEVLAAMTLFAIGAAGVISMQRVSIKGGTDARQFDVATNIAREWQHRLQRDAMFWTKPNANEPTTPPNLADTKWLGNVTNAWISPPSTATPIAGTSGVFDMFGRDVVAGDDTRMFCAQYRLQWIADPGSPPKATAVMRADIRVIWARQDRGVIDCASPNPGFDEATARTHYVMVNLATAIRGNPTQ